MDVLRELVATWKSAFVEGEAGGIVKLLLTEARDFPVLADFWLHELTVPIRGLVTASSAASFAPWIPTWRWMRWCCP